MGLNNTPSAVRIHIGFFGKRNAGKSSLVNAVTNQNLSIVSSVLGTTTDPVLKSMELLPLGPVVIIDTPGFDDQGELGKLRIQKAKQVLVKTDVAVLVSDATRDLEDDEKELISLFKAKEINYIIAKNKSDLLKKVPKPDKDSIYVSALNKVNIKELKDIIAHLSVREDSKLQLVGDLIHPSDFVVLVTPIDKSAPKGRLILPQQQTIRDILEADATSIVVKEYELRDTLANLGKKPVMVITDSQVFAKVAADTPLDIPLTSFSILQARYKGLLEAAVDGIAAIEDLEDGDTVLIAEGCTHHRSCDDIGSVKIPRWLKNYTQKKIKIETCSGGAGFPDDLSSYKVIIHCGGCMLTEKEVIYRTRCAINQGVPITNYGLVIAYIQGILERSLELFPYLHDKLESNNEN
ncbi:MAG: [FeFe] hydrogenase H-cluster maturation GTPase HydF [Treponema sp. CETP13]|nr:MAG: [FeFe] hydrogenase H-cluster maturation GTPase HydF [Treponema sp. CETP13]